MIINNLPANVSDYRYIVAREIDGAYWYWGAWNDADAANEAALEVGGETFPADWFD